MKFNNNTYTSAGIFIALIAGFFIPNGAAFKPFIPWLLGIMLFFSFLKIEFSAGHFFRRELVYYPLIVIIAVPLIIYFATPYMSAGLRLGLMLLCITPPATSAPVVAGFIDARRELVITNVLIYNIFAPFVYASLLPLYFKNADIVISPLKILASVSIIIFVPLLLAFIVRLSSRLSGMLEKAAPSVTPPVLFLVVASGIASASDEIKLLFIQQPFNAASLLLLVVVICVSLFFIGSLLSKEMQVKKALALSLGHKNTALAISIALTNFEPITAVPAILYVLTQNTINGFLISRGGKTSDAAEKEVY